MSRLVWSILALLGLTVVSVFSAIALGSEHVALRDVYEVLWYHRSARSAAPAVIADRIVWQLRLPRVLLALLVGGGLAIIGVAMQTLVRLAEEHPEVFSDPAPSAVAKGFGASSVDLELRFYVEPIRSSVIKVYTDLIHSVHDTFRQEGLNIAFPHVQIVQGQPWKMEE